jgi:predicted amidohydrolase
MEEVQVVHAGSVPCERLHGFFCNSYNVIEIKKKRINAKLKIVDAGYVDFKEIVRRREILQASDISQYKSLTQET